MIHRFVDLPSVIISQYVPINGSTGGNNSIWDLTRSPGQDPTERTNTTVTTIVAPILNPAGSKILFSQTGNLMEVSVTGSPGDEVLIWDGATGVTGFAYSPDGTTILFTISDASNRHRLYTIPASGTNQSGNETAIYSDASSRQVCGAAYNYSGTKVGFHVLLSATSLGIWVCNADGTSASQLATSPTQFSAVQFNQPAIGWMNGSSRLAWNDGTIASPVWKTMLDDGTSVVTLGTLASGDGRPTWNTWFSDDSYIIRRKASDGSIHKLAAGGGGDSLLITPTASATGAIRIFGDRVYWGDSVDVWSCLTDGTDERNETGASAVNFGLL